MRTTSRLLEAAKKDRITGEFDVFGHKFINDKGKGQVTALRPKVNIRSDKDYGSDPIFDENGNSTGKVRLVPSGRIVTGAEAKKILDGN